MLCVIVLSRWLGILHVLLTCGLSHHPDPYSKSMYTEVDYASWLCFLQSRPRPDHNFFSCSVDLWVRVIQHASLTLTLIVRTLALDPWSACLTRMFPEYSSHYSEYLAVMQGTAKIICYNEWMTQDNVHWTKKIILLGNPWNRQQSRFLCIHCQHPWYCWIILIPCYVANWRLYPLDFGHSL